MTSILRCKCSRSCVSDPRTGGVLCPGCQLPPVVCICPLPDLVRPYTGPDQPCPHYQMDTEVGVYRILAEGAAADAMPDGFMAEVRIRCANPHCRERFLFLGPPAGMRPDRPTVSVDRAELRAPIRPESHLPAYPTDVVVPTGDYSPTGETSHPDRLTAPRGEHVWTAVAAFRTTSEAIDAGRVVMDAASVGVVYLACYACERRYSPQAAGTPCQPVFT